MNLETEAFFVPKNDTEVSRQPSVARKVIAALSLTSTILAGSCVPEPGEPPTTTVPTEQWTAYDVEGNRIGVYLGPFDEEGNPVSEAPLDPENPNQYDLVDDEWAIEDDENGVILPGINLVTDILYTDSNCESEAYLVNQNPPIDGNWEWMNQHPNGALVNVLWGEPHTIGDSESHRAQFITQDGLTELDNSTYYSFDFTFVYPNSGFVSCEENGSSNVGESVYPVDRINDYTPPEIDETVVIVKE